MSARVDAGVKPGPIHPDLIGESLQVRDRQVPCVTLWDLPLEQGVSVFPELPLIRRALRCLGAANRLVAEEGEIAPDEARLARGDVLRLQLSPWTQGVIPTGRSLKVAPLNEHQGRVRVPEADLAGRCCRWRGARHAGEQEHGSEESESHGGCVHRVRP